MLRDRLRDLGLVPLESLDDVDDEMRRPMNLVDLRLIEEQLSQ
jgi:hypothetical protein